MTHIITFANQKGGVGKTTLAVHMAILAHELGLNTLLVDLDQQGSSTFLVSGDGDLHKTSEGTVLDLWDDSKPAPLQRSAIFGFDFLQASYLLDAVDKDIREAIRVLGKLRHLDSGQGLYDVVVIDCPPAPNVRQMAPMFITNSLVVPVTPDALGTQGLSSMMDLCLGEVIQLNSELSVRVLINRLKGNSTKNWAIAKDLQSNLAQIVMPQILFEREDVRSALRIGKPYWAACRDKEQQDAWYQAFYSLLRNLSDTAESQGEEADEGEDPSPLDADAILETQEARRGTFDAPVVTEETPREAGSPDESPDSGEPDSGEPDSGEPDSGGPDSGGGPQIPVGGKDEDDLLDKLAGELDFEASSSDEFDPDEEEGGAA